MTEPLDAPVLPGHGWAELALDDEITTAGRDGGCGGTPRGRWTVDGRHCATRAQLFDEWSRALGFPDYFGRNWDAFDECLSDLLVGGAGFGVPEAGQGSCEEITVRNAENLLVAEPVAELTTFIRVLDAVAGLTRPEPDGPGLRVLFRTSTDEAGDLRDRLRTAAPGRQERR
ncbi:barstar family protein [Actinoalloteichus spitiensis]|uniref:barstar family protein n=1 Tax=Actinoalloteichus spitiensis TaxID=252394 RepID=UPI00035C1566|nr:barstar family protein [Actinoalloteichus spitiensis]